MNIVLKRFFSCLSVATLCLFTNLGITAKAGVVLNTTGVYQNNAAIHKDNAFVLYPGNEILNIDSYSKIANHYSHSSHSSHFSHSSHVSHYSSRY